MRLEKLMVLLLAIVLVFGLVAVPGCSTEEEPVEEEVVEEVEEEAVDWTAEMIAAGAEYLGSDPAATISADDLFTVVQSEDPGYQIVSVRSADHYAIGHIEGSINVPFKTIYEEENLEMLDPDKKIVVVCYTGHTASQATMFYNLLGYDATALKYGMSGWTTDEDVYALDPFPTGAAAGLPTVTEVPEAGDTYDLPMVEGDYEEVRDAIIMAAEDYFAAEIPFTISAADVNTTVVETQDPNYQILSVRGTEDYEAAHLPDAMNVPWKAIADETKLEMLDPDKKTIVYCYTGHTGGQVSMFLNLLGYETINMKHGMCGWTDDADINVFGCYSPDAVPNHPTVTE